MTDNLERESQFSQLVLASRHPNEYVRAGALRSLGVTANLKAVEILVAAFSDSVREVQSAAASALAALGAPALGSILSLLQDPPVPEAKAFAKDALSQVRDPEAMSLLCAALSYPEPEARMGAAIALGEIGDHEGIDPLVEATQHAHLMTRREACIALGKIGGERAEYAMTSFLRDEDWQLREAATQALGKMDGEQVVHALLIPLLDPVWNVQHSAAKALQEVQEPWAVNLLLNLLAHETPWVRMNAAEALGWLGEDDAIDPLHVLANEDVEIGVRLRAAQALAVLGDERGARVIERTLNAPNAYTRQLAAIALGNTGSPQAIPQLVESDGMRGVQIETPEGRYLRERVIGALVRIGADAVPVLIQQLESREPSVRDGVVEALELIGEDAVPLLLKALAHNPSLKVREQIIPILGTIRSELSGAPLEHLLRKYIITPYFFHSIQAILYDPERDLREKAAAALGELGGAEYLGVLVTSAQYDPDITVRGAATQALARIGDAESVLTLARPSLFRNLFRAGISLSFLFLAVGVLIAMLIWAGASPVSMLTGVLLGAAFGLSDGFGAYKEPIRYMFAGVLLVGFLRGLGLILIRLGLFQSTALFPEPFTFAVILLPMFGALAGWRKITLLQRLLGLFIGMSLGFTSAGIGAALINMFLGK